MTKDTTCKNILVYGDSNAWGWVPRPEIFPSTRYPKSKRWPEIMARRLGDDYDVFCDALSGRTTSLDEPMPDFAPDFRNGAAKIDGAVAAHMPLDLVIIALGTNDFKDPFQRDVNTIAQEIIALAKRASENTGVSTKYAPPAVLILCPPPLGPLHPEDWAREVFSQNSLDKSKGLAAVLNTPAKSAGFSVFEAGSVMQTEGVDGVHFTEQNHLDLGTAMAKVVGGVLQSKK